MKRILLFLISFACINIVSAQNFTLDTYKYVIVNSKYDFVKSTDGYQTSSLTKFLFDKMGFETYLDNQEYPDELAMNPCAALYVDIKDDSGMLLTRSMIELKDCKGKVLYTTPKGTSRFKQYVKAYRESIKEAFQSIRALGYNYDASLQNQPSRRTIVKKDETEEQTKKVKRKPIMVTKEVSVKKTTSKEPQNEKPKLETLYAQPNENGFQLVNTEPKIVFVLLKTSDANKFFIKDKNGTFTKKGDVWLAEYYENGVLVTKNYQIKF
jgi:hypothetical protein